MTVLLTSPAFLDHDTGEGHPESPERLRSILRGLDAQPWAKELRRAEPPLPKGEDLLAVHDAAMMARSRELCQAGGGVIDGDTVVSKASWEAAVLAAGAVVEGARRVARGDERSAYCAVRPPGHHATRDKAMGFCLLNNVAIAARRVLDLKSARRVAIFDHDVHHGNGTQDLFYASPDVLYMSVHQWPLYPGTGRVAEVGEREGAGFTVNLPVKAGTGDDAYARLLDEIVLPVAESFAPDLWLVSAGYDSHAQDLLGSLALTSDFYASILRKLAEVQPRIVVALEGGYHLDAIARSAASQVGYLLGHDVRWDEKARGDADVGPLIKEAKRALDPYWTL
ncbi:MAG TPA: histone deacetylase [Candidatus Thermoplasmatota archaeon]|nr:histone deacetylase [Candidatus Thermoplasmatota archaeon]